MVSDVIMDMPSARQACWQVKTEYLIRVWQELADKSKAFNPGWADLRRLKAEHLIRVSQMLAGKG